MIGPKLIVLWRVAAIGGLATTWAAIIDQRVITAYGFLLVFALVWVALFRELVEKKR